MWWCTVASRSRRWVLIFRTKCRGNFTAFRDVHVLDPSFGSSPSRRLNFFPSFRRGSIVTVVSCARPFQLGYAYMATLTGSTYTYGTVSNISSLATSDHDATRTITRHDQPLACRTRPLFHTAQFFIDKAWNTVTWWEECSESALMATDRLIQSTLVTLD